MVALIPFSFLQERSASLFSLTVHFSGLGAFSLPGVLLLRDFPIHLGLSQFDFGKLIFDESLFLL